MARANPQSVRITAGLKVLVIFNGPDAYVSPSLYSTKQAVPTWNYVAVHAYGAVEVIDERAEKDKLLQRLVGQHEPAYDDQWRDLPDEYRQRMLDAIVGFRIRVTHLEAKFKLSQNRPVEDRERVQQAFSSTPDAKHQALAAWMKRLEL